MIGKPGLVACPLPKHPSILLLYEPLQKDLNRWDVQACAAPQAPKMFVQASCSKMAGLPAANKRARAGPLCTGGRPGPSRAIGVAREASRSPMASSGQPTGPAASGRAPSRTWPPSAPRWPLWSWVRPVRSASLPKSALHGFIATRLLSLSRTPNMRWARTIKRFVMPASLMMSSCMESSK